MYILYQSNLAEYTGNSLSIIPNPSSRIKVSQEPLIVYGKSLYFQLTTTDMGKFDGTSVSVVANTKGYANFPILYNDHLFGYHYDSLRKVTELGYLDTSSVLAVKVLTLTAQLQNNNAILHWQTENEDNSTFFNVQRSFDGINFITIEKMPANNNVTISNYAYADNNVNQLGVVNLFYRLRSVDKNGAGKYSDIVTIHLSKLQQLFSVSPNPAKDFIKIAASSNVSNASIRVTDLRGKTLYLAKGNFAPGQTLKVVTSQLPAEVLFVTILADGHFEQFKIVKE